VPPTPILTTHWSASPHLTYKVSLSLRDLVTSAMSSSMFPTPRTPYTKAVLAFIDEFETWDTSKIEPLLADGVEVSFMPRAMGVPTTKGKQLMLKGFVQLKPFVGVLKVNSGIWQDHEECLGN
jgi:hypothetical protein